MRIKSGGGITSNKYVTSKAPKVEPKARAMSPEAVAQQGAAQPFVSLRWWQAKAIPQRQWVLRV